MNLTERRRALMVTATSGSPHGKCGPYAYWSIKDGVLTISGSGTMYNDATHYKPDFPAPWNEYNDDIFEIEVQDGITYISQYAFYHLTNVEKATIPESVVYVHAHAFNGCTALEDVYFYMKSGEVYYWAFQDCNARKRIHIASVADYCNVKLDQISYPAETDLILNGTKVTDLVIPSGVKTTNTFNHMTIETVFIPRSAALRDVAFEMCTHLRSVTFERGSKITSVPANAFRGCSSLVNIDNLPDTIEIINGGSFAQCPLLQMEQLPASLTAIKSNQYGAFSGSSSISISSLPDTLTDLPQGCFSNCANVAIASYPPNLTNIGSAAVNGTATTANRIPATVATLGRGCLANNITALYFEGTPTSINTYALENLYALLDIYVPWAKDEVAGAPWCATNATVHYNYTG